MSDESHTATVSVARPDGSRLAVQVPTSRAAGTGFVTVSFGDIQQAFHAAGHSFGPPKDGVMEMGPDMVIDL